MRTISLLLFCMAASWSIAQTKQPGVKATVEVQPPFEKLFVSLHSESVALDHCRLQILNSNDKVIRTVHLAKSQNHVDTAIVITELLPGNYSCLVYNGKVELLRKEFFKDAIFAEPVHYNPPRQ